MPVDITQALGGELVTPGQQEQQVGPNPADVLANNVTAAQQNAPQLSPGSALAVGANGGNVADNAQALAAGQFHQQVAQGHDNVNQGSGGLLGDVIGIARKVAHPLNVLYHDTHLNTAVSDVGRALNYPLSIAQHEYRYYHDVEARYGMTEAMMEALGAAAAGAGGFAASGGNFSAGMLSAQAATYMEAKLLHPNSWQITANGNDYRDPHTHDIVSLGRDVAHALGLRGTTFGTWSGVIDGIGDLGMDPLARSGDLVAAARSAEGLGGILKYSFPGKALNPDNIDLLNNAVGPSGASFRRAVDLMSRMDAGQIVTYTPQWSRLAPIAHALGAAQTPDEVLEVLRMAVKTKELLTDTLPSISYTTKAAKAARDLALNYDGFLANNFIVGPQAWGRRFTNIPGVTYDRELKKFTGNVMNFNDASSVVDGHRMIMYSQGKAVADNWATGYIHATPQERVGMFQGAVIDTITKMSIENFERQLARLPKGANPDDLVQATAAGKARPSTDFASMGEYWNYRMSMLRHEDVRQNLQTHLQEIMGLANPGPGGVYGMRLDGEASRPVLVLDDEGNIMQKQSVGLYENQVGSAVVPTFTQVKRMAAELAGAYNFSGKLDDFAYGSITQGIFKPLVLLSLSYANHIALAELIPNTLRLGMHNMISGYYHTWMARLGYKMMDNIDNDREINALMGWTYKVLHGIPHSKERESIMTAVALATEGHMVTPAVSAGENYGREIAMSARIEGGFRNFLSFQSMALKRHDKNFALLGKDVLGRDVFAQDWQAAIRERSRSEFGQLAAQKLRDLMDEHDLAVGPPPVKVPTQDPLGGKIFGYHGTSRPFPNHQLDPFYWGSGGGINLVGPGIYITDNHGLAATYPMKGIYAATGADEWGLHDAAHDMGEVWVPPGHDPHVYGMRWIADHDPHLLDMEAPPPDEVRSFLTEWVRENLSLRLEESGAFDARTRLSITDPVIMALGDPTADMYDIYERIQNAFRSLHHLDPDSMQQLPELMDLARDLHSHFGYDGLTYEGGLRTGSPGPRHQVMVLWPLLHGAGAPEAVAAAARDNMQRAQELSDHQALLAELEDDLTTKTHSIPTNLGRHERIARMARINSSRGWYSNMPEYQRILDEHGMTADGMARLEEESIPRLASEAGEAESRLAEANGGLPEFPIEVANHTGVSAQELYDVQEWMAEHPEYEHPMDEATDAVAQALRQKAERDPSFAQMMRRANGRSEPNPDAGTDQYDDWAREIVEDIAAHAGARQGEPMAMNGTVLDHIADGIAPSLSTLKNIPVSEWPEKVKGRTILADGSSRVQRIADIGFRKIINPWVNTVARTPIFAAEMFKHMKAMQPMIDQGVLDWDEALTKSLHVSSTNMTRFIHNLHDRTQWSETMRNWAPFYFAQEQAYRRMGRLLMEDPGAMRRYQMMIAQVGHMAASATNPQGQGFYTFPGGTWLARGVSDAFNRMGLKLVNVDAGGFDVSLSSASVIFPLSTKFQPDASPIAALSAKTLQHFFPGMEPELETILGKPTMSSGLISQLIPNSTVNRVFNAVQGGMGQPGRAFASSMMQAMQLAMYDQNVAMERWNAGGRKGPMPSIVPTQQQAADPTVLQNFIDRIKNQTMVLYITNSVLGFFSPVSPTVTIKNFGLPAQLQNDINSSGSVAKGMTKFLLAHPDATPYTVFQSSTVAGGTLPESFPAENWINQNMGFIKNYPLVAPYMMPKVSTTYSPAVYDEQIAQGIRIKRNPMLTSGDQSFMVQMYVAAGNQVYYQALTQHENNLTAIGNSSAAKSQEYTNWNQYLQQLQTQAPIWAANGPTSNLKNTRMQQQISQLRAMIANGDVPNNPNAQMLAQLTGYYNGYEAQYTAAGETFNYSRNQTRIRNAWKSYLDGIIQQQPQLSAAIRAVFYDALGQAPES